MTDEQRPGHSDTELPSHLLGLEGDDLELTRLADLLTALEDGPAPLLNHEEDPSLASLVSTVSAIRTTLGAATDGARFEAFQYDSRGRIQAALPAPTARRIVSGASVPWYRRWQLTAAPLATAAAAIVATVFLVGGLSGGAVPASDETQTVTQPVSTPSTSVATVATETPVEDSLVANLTRLSVDENLTYLQDLRTKLEARVAAGEPVDAQTLDELTTAIEVLTQRLSNTPDEFQPIEANTFHATTGLSAVALSQASVEPGDESALEAAQASAQDGIVVAAGYSKDHGSAAADGVTLDVAPADDE